MSKPELDAAPVASRRAARRVAFQVLYAVAVAASDTEDALEAALAGSELDASVAPFLRGLVEQGVEGGSSFDSVIAEYLAPGWTPERLAWTDRIALRMACGELWNLHDVPPKVTLDEYVELAKRFGGAESGRFVNGVLGKVLAASPKADWTPPARFEVPEPVVEPETVAPEPTQEAPTLPWVLRSEPVDSQG